MPSRVRVASTIELSRGEVSLLRRLARTPLNQLVVLRRATIRLMRRRGFSRKEIGQWLRIRHEDVVSEEEAG